MTSKNSRISEPDMDKLFEKGYTEEPGYVLGWKSGVLCEPKDQLETQKKLR